MSLIHKILKENLEKRDKISLKKFGKYHSELKPWEQDVIDEILK